MDAAAQYAEPVLNTQFSMESTTYLINPALTKDVLNQKYVVEKLTIGQIAKENLCSKATVSKYLHLYGFQVSKRGASLLNPPNPAYGERRYRKKIVKNHAEQQVITLILKLNKSGLSLRAIARMLNNMNVPTRRGDGKWHHEVIKSIIKKFKQGI